MPLSPITCREYHTDTHHFARLRIAAEPHLSLCPFPSGQLRIRSCRNARTSVALAKMSIVTAVPFPFFLFLSGSLSTLAFAWRSEASLPIQRLGTCGVVVSYLDQILIKLMNRLLKVRSWWLAS
ncbi:UNVERIFIED_CONTAM: hypothetical protein Slati_3058300 [Sesamum latifolium]|uniref:Uncharacterized protein n=1 Tax=Sesamum latifolium TaxID=2727402 RepID=A0AAW2USY6_9LAMI